MKSIIVLTGSRIVGLALYFGISFSTIWLIEKLAAFLPWREFLEPFQPGMDFGLSSVLVRTGRAKAQLRSVRPIGPYPDNIVMKPLVVMKPLIERQGCEGFVKQIIRGLVSSRMAISLAGLQRPRPKAN